MLGSAKSNRFGFDWSSLYVYKLQKKCFHDATISLTDRAKEQKLNIYIPAEGSTTTPCPHRPRHVHTMSTPCPRHFHIMFTPCPHRVHKVSTPCPHHVHTISTPCPHHVHTVSPPCPHRVCTLATPRPHIYHKVMYALCNNYLHLFSPVKQYVCYVISYLTKHFICCRIHDTR